ncbi:M14 family zinc carboxypeptidase [Virgibacillus kimchii]
MMKKLIIFLFTAILVIGGSASVVLAKGNGPNYGGNETVNTSILHTYEEMIDYLEKQESKQHDMELEVIGQTVKERDIFLVKYMTNPDNPTILYLAQQHGDEALVTEGMLDFIKHLGTGKTKGLTDDVNLLFIPMFNADGAMGDVDYPLEDYADTGDRNLTRYNANEVDLNRDHADKTQPETQALHQNVLEVYDIDYMIDLHHQGAQWVIDGDYVSGAIFPPHEDYTDPEVLKKSKQLGAVIYDRIQPKGWGLLANYAGPGSAYSEEIGVYGIASNYDISTFLFEMRGTQDNAFDFEVLGQKSNGYLIKQSYEAMDASARAVADGSIEDKDISFWDTLPVQEDIREQ